jgi:hypothetical protein
VLLVSELFGLAPGSQININKTEGMWLGSLQGSGNICNIDFSRNSVKILGVHFSQSLDTVHKCNWQPLIKNVTTSLNILQSRRLSYKGKVYAISSFVLSKLWYLGTIIPMPSHVLFVLNHLIFSYFWNHSTERIKRTTLYLPKEQGGLGLPSIHLKLLALFIKHICYIIHNDCLYTPYVDYFIGISLRHYKVLQLTGPHSEQIPPFYSRIEKFHQFIEQVQNFDIGTAKTKHIYHLLVQQEMHELPRVLTKFPTIDFGRAFQNVNYKVIDPDTYDVAYQIMHDVLPVNDRLYRHGVYRQNTPCHFCETAVETIDHLFIHCTFLVSVWNYISIQLSSYAAQPVLLDRNCIIFNLTSCFRKTVDQNMLLLCTNIIKSAIWKFRNTRKHERKKESVNSIKHLVIWKLKVRCFADYNRYTAAKFQSFWCKNNIFCQLVDNQPVFLLR